MNVKITSRKVEQLKALCRGRQLPTMGTKSELIQRLVKAIGTEEVDVEEDVMTATSLQQQINELYDMLLLRYTKLMQRNNERETREHETREIINASTNDSISLRANTTKHYSVKEIAETTPQFDPTNDSSVTAEQFISRVENIQSAYNWDEKCVPLAVFNRMMGAAKMWLDASN